MNVKDLMTTQFLTIPDITPYLEAVKLFLEHNIYGAPVINAEGTLVGVLSERDLLRALYPSSKDFYTQPEQYMLHSGLEESMQDAQKKQVKYFMSTELVTTSPDIDIIRVGGIMVASGIHRMPVVDRHHKLLGMISRHDIYEHIMRHTFNLAPDHAKV